ncbi:MAG: leucine-rich repeat domain-containing protein [Prevotella sp.]|nr:leucine-rich repeat domain-containing protein [Prevotella sp.]
MKRILIMIMSVSPMFASAQEEYESFLEEGKVWTLCDRLTYIDYIYYNWEMKLSGDTIIDGIHFKQRLERKWEWGEEKPEGWNATKWYVGQDGGKTYLHSRGQTMLDMDFTLEVGDTFQSNDFGSVKISNPNLLVTEVSDMAFPLYTDKKPRKCVYLQTLTGINYQTDVWVEGIGSLIFGIMGTWTYRLTTGSGAPYVLSKNTLGEEVLYDGTVENNHKVTVGGLKYCLYTDTHTAAIDGGNTWSGELEIPTEISYGGETYTVKGISSKAFWNCTELTKVRVPKTIDRIMRHICFDEDPIGLNMNPFVGCSSLESIEVDADNPIFRSEGGIMFSKDGKRLYAYPSGKKDETYAVPEDITWIGGAAFRDNANLVSVELPATITRLCGASFAGCKRLETVDLPESLTCLEGCLFSGCTNLKTVEIPAGVKVIGFATFYGCTSLKTIDLPESVQTIGWIPFMGCKPEAVVIRGTLNSEGLNEHICKGLDESSTLYVPATEIDRYKDVFSGKILALDEYQTGIQAPTSANDDTGLIYDLSGRRVQGTPKKGVYIQNGEKVVIK